MLMTLGLSALALVAVAGAVAFAYFAGYEAGSRHSAETAADMRRRYSSNSPGDYR